MIVARHAVSREDIAEVWEQVATVRVARGNPAGAQQAWRNAAIVRDAAATDRYLSRRWLDERTNRVRFT